MLTLLRNGCHENIARANKKPKRGGTPKMRAAVFTTFLYGARNKNTNTNKIYLWHRSSPQQAASAVGARARSTRNRPDALACTSRDYLVRVEQDGDLVYDGTRTLTELRPAG